MAWPQQRSRRQIHASPQTPQTAVRCANCSVFPGRLRVRDAERDDYRDHECVIQSSVHSVLQICLVLRGTHHIFTLTKSSGFSTHKAKYGTSASLLCRIIEKGLSKIVVCLAQAEAPGTLRRPKEMCHSERRRTPFSSSWKRMFWIARRTTRYGGNLGVLRDETVAFELSIFTCDVEIQFRHLQDIAKIRLRRVSIRGTGLHDCYGISERSCRWQLGQNRAYPAGPLS